MNEKQSTGREYWQSLSELAETPGAQQAVESEFPGYDPNEMVSQSRRRFLQLAGASMALAGISLTGCRRWPKELIVPHVSRPQGQIPGVAEQYATVFELGGFAQPLLVTTYDGRPIKIEGNPMHPQCRTFGGKLGATTVFAQATLLEMYDPERSRSVIAQSTESSAVRRQAATWADFVAFANGHFGKYKADGAKLAVLTEQTSSPTTLDQLARFTKAFPGAKVYQYEPISRDNQLAADTTSFGQAVRQVYDLTKADVIVSFDSDLLGLHPNALRQINDWSQRRRSVDADQTMNRMYVVESMFSTTGTLADERLPATVRKIEAMILQLAHEAGLPESGQGGLSDADRKLVQQIWTDLKDHAGKALVAGGPNLRPEVLGVINAINGRLDSFGNTIHLLPETARETHNEQIKALAAALDAGQIETIIILGGNPVYDAPSDLNFSGVLLKAPTSVHLSLYDNETSALCRWHVNRAHYLESWGDAISWDGYVSIQQPMIEPLFNGKTPGEVLATVMGDEVTTAQGLMYRVWSARLNEPFVATSKPFRKLLHDGFLPAPAEPVKAGNINKPNVGFPSSPEGMEVRFVPDYTLYDGRFANNGWLQECPDPITKITWDNVALLSYADAKALGLEQRDAATDLVKVTLDGRELTLPGFVLPGQPKGVITISLGYGRERAGGVVLTDRAGSIGHGIGYKSYDLRTTGNMWVGYGATIVKLNETARVASTQLHHVIEPMGMEIRAKRVGLKSQPGKIVHESTLKAFIESKGSAPHSAAHKMLPLQLFPEPWTGGNKPESLTKAFNDPHAWGMAIDMNTCVGCNACVVACQAENNIPTVGKDGVIRNREMHWLRIDRYFKTNGSTYDEMILDENPQVTYQPMMCVHCENAPCEQVCPVAATVHDSEGLNTMVYNRCIGTRYCQNNCPYKVRRFNYFDYQSLHPREGSYPWLGIPDTQQQHEVNKIKRMVFNPEVTVRMRGVIEKCTYCVQRIKNVTIDARNDWQQGERDKPTVNDFEVVSACQQACPAEAIVFGDLNDPNALVSKLHRNQRSYGVLEELNNRPRTLHLAKLRNPVTEPPVAESEH
ncbi:MAG TPA: TAT-variant-translocated molybdopterin oxidoreductase [Tepidisphaeraceae bacterium]